MNLTKGEFDVMVKNVKEIFTFLKNEIAPELKDCVKVKYSDSPDKFDLVLMVFPGGKISFFRNSMRSSEYRLGEEFDWKRSEELSDLYHVKNIETMYGLIKEWPNLKKQFLNFIE